MADHPRDQAKPHRPGPPPPAAAGEISGREVIAYLRRNPDFIERHPEALRVLRPPARDTGAGIADFQQFLLERLRRDLAQAQTEQRSLIATSRGNLASQGRVHKAVLAILSAPSFAQLLQIVTTDLAVLLDVDVVTLGVESAATGTVRLPLSGIRLLRSGTVDGLIGADRQVVFCAETQGDPVLFGSAAGLVHSQALLRLSFGRTAPAGMLCIGARKPSSFHPGLGTELLSFLARALGIAIRQWLDPAR